MSVVSATLDEVGFWSRLLADCLHQCSKKRKLRWCQDVSHMIYTLLKGSNFDERSCPGPLVGGIGGEKKKRS